MRERVPPFQNWKNSHAKLAAKLPILRLLLEVWMGEARSRFVFLEVFARWPLVLPDDNIQEITKNESSFPTVNRFYSINVFVKTNALGVAILWDGLFDGFLQNIVKYVR